MQLQKTLTKFTTIIITLLVTVIPQTAQAGPDVSKITTYEALLDTFRAYPGTIGVEVRNNCLDRMYYLNDSMKIPASEHMEAINTILSLGLHDTFTLGWALGSIGHLELHNFEDTIFLVMSTGDYGFFGTLAKIGGHRTSEYFKTIIQHYNFDKYELQTIGALVDMNDSAFYLIPEIKKYRDSIESYYGKNCPLVPPEISRCWDLWDYRENAKAAVVHMEYMQSLHHTDVEISPQKNISQPQVNSHAVMQKLGCIYTPDGKLMRGPLIKNGVYIKDGKLIVNMENGK